MKQIMDVFRPAVVSRFLPAQMPKADCLDIESGDSVNIMFVCCGGD
jgi:hypothetical protein